MTKEKCTYLQCDNMRKLGCHGCLEHTCAKNGCITKVDTDHILCKNHKCEKTGCLEPHEKHKTYCPNHCCLQGSCKNEREIGSTFCYKHKCLYCSQQRRFGSQINPLNTCKNHKCLHKNCDYDAGKHGYCSGHTCYVNGCIAHGDPLCIEHKCPIDGCLQVRGFCHHSCSYLYCRNMKMTGYEVCNLPEHRCIFDKCKNVTVYGKEACNIHRCKYTFNCGKVIFHANAETCSEHKCLGCNPNEYTAQPAMYRGDYCRIHGCVVCGKKGHPYCEIHRCIVNTCQREKMFSHNDIGTCDVHTCHAGGCLLPVTDGHRACEIHRCKFIGCYCEKYYNDSKFCYQHTTKN